MAVGRSWLVAFVSFFLFVVGASHAPASAASCPGNPKGLGVSRTVEIDTTGGVGLGLEQYKAHDFLQQGEVILTFDDGPWPANTEAVLKALADHCTKATFFIIGKHAVAHPHILKKVAAAGHTIGTHTWSHANLARKKMLKDQRGVGEIEKGFSAVAVAMGTPPAAFFRFPYLQDPDELVAYLSKRNVGIISMDVDSFDFKHKRADKLIKAVIRKLKKKGKGILLLHDFQKVTAKAMPALLNALQKEGFRIVHMKAAHQVATVKKYDEEVSGLIRGPIKDTRPTSSVIRTVPSE